MKRFARIAILFLLFSVWCCSLSQAQEASTRSFRFELFDLPNGESGNHVQSIAQDSVGFMWFASQFGLHRWDGYQFKTYLNDPLDPRSISSSYVEYLYVAKDGTLWLGTWGGGLSAFDQKTEVFTNYHHEQGNPESLSDDFISEITEDGQGYLWVATQHGLSRLDRKTGKFKQFFNDPNDPSSISYNICRSIYLDSEETLWIGTGWAWDSDNKGGLNRYDPKTESFTRYIRIANDQRSLSSNKITDIFEDSRGNFWICTGGDGLHLMDRKSGTFTRLENKPGREGQISSPWLGNIPEAHTKFIFEDQDQKLWIGAWLGGIKYYDPETGEIQLFSQGSSANSIPDNNVWNMFQTNEGTLWGWTAGTENARVFKIIREESVFDYFNLKLSGVSQAFCYQNDRYLWFSTNNDGLQRLDLDTGDHLIYRDDPQNPKAENGFSDLEDYVAIKERIFDNISHIVLDQAGNLWLGKRWDSVKYGLMRLNPDTGELMSYKREPGKPGSLSSNQVTDIKMDEAGRIWVATGDGVLNLFDAASNSFKKYEMPLGVDEAHWENVISRISVNPAGEIWVSGVSNKEPEIPLFLLRFDPTLEMFQTFEVKEHRNGDLWVLGVEEDVSGNIWLATNNELQKINTQTGVVKFYSPQEFHTSMFQGILMDDNGLIWLTGDRLIAFDPTNETSFSYGTIAGIKLVSFFYCSIYKASSGHIFFGGKNGFQVFDPNELRARANGKAPEIIITDFKLLDRKEDDFLTNQEYFNSESAIQLKYDQNVFAFRFAVLDFQQPGNNIHEFQLVGYDNYWRKAGVEPIATYIKVPPGEYLFRVRAANHRGVWGSTKSIRVIISPPWWKTWWAYTVYGVLIISLVYGVYQFQLRRSLDKEEARRLRELDSVKTQLYTNITHEFRTPLTVILGMARQVISQPKEHFREGMDMIVRNGESLLSLVNQMLDLSKLESGRMALHLKQGEIVSFLKYLVESFHSFAESKQVRMHFLSEVDELTMDFDSEKLQQIVLNLISNAVKFTPAGGDVYFSLSQQAALSPSPQNVGASTLLIKVKDNGKGIPEEDILHIFDRFYQVDVTNTRESGGSGIGLSLTKELVKLMDGEIHVKSREGHGAEFSVIIPVLQAVETRKLKTVEDVLHLQAPPSRAIPAPVALESREDTNTEQISAATILIMEDNPDVVQYLSSCLAGDYRLNIATDGQEGIDIALETIPDLIISDIMMPQKDGFEVCEILKNEERTSHIPIIMLTAKADIESKLEGLERGADAYLEKPFHKEELLVRIKKLLELRQKLQTYYRGAAGLNDSSEWIQDIPDVKQVEDKFVLKVRELVLEHLDNFEFTVEQLCREIGMSNSQLHRKLTAVTGLSATRFIRYVRLNKAKEFLVDTEYSITAIAFDCGFNDPSYFGRVFKKEFGVTALEWRNSMLKES
ncbi:MAG: response regulator [Saprospiraceae bacterium]|nr:response regulator [Saprospiraceae bacterium]